MILHSVLNWISSFVLPFALATTFMAVPFSQFTRESSTIVRGVIRSTRVDVGILSDGSKTVHTFAQLEIADTLKGDTDLKEITLRKIGGSKDGMSLDVPGSPEFIEGTEGLWFLRFVPSEGVYEVQGLELGQMTIEGSGENARIRGGLLELSSGTSFEENKRPWTLHELRELLQKQKSEPPAPSRDSPSDPDASPSEVVFIDHHGNHAGAADPDHSKNQNTEAAASSHSDAPSSNSQPLLGWVFLGVGGALLAFYLLKRIFTLKA